MTSESAIEKSVNELISLHGDYISLSKVVEEAELLAGGVPEEGKMPGIDFIEVLSIAEAMLVDKGYSLGDRHEGYERVSQKAVF